MPQLARSLPTAEPAWAKSPPPSAIAALTDQIEWAESPARLLHDRLFESFAPVRPEPHMEPRLSARRRLAICAVAAILPWIAIGSVVNMLLG